MYKDLLKPYKFYLSFEHTRCEQYISEKFFTVFRTKEAIPVALGGVSVQDYSNAAPPHSYIHVDDYPSISALAQKLEYLARNETAYKEYFWWTEHYRVSSVWEHYASAQCDLCEKINLAKQNKVTFPNTHLFEDLTSEKTCVYDKRYF